MGICCTTSTQDNSTNDKTQEQGEPVFHGFEHAAAAAAAQPLRILAFGDSLTEGYLNYGMIFHPYSDHLEQLLKESHGPTCQVVQCGVSGECVLEGMGQRLATELLDAEADNHRYQWVCILAGINDVGNHSKGEAIFAGLQEMYQICVMHGAKILAMTCMENSGSTSQHDVHRQTLNNLIKKFCYEYPDSALLLDLDKLVPYTNVPAAEQEEMFDDGLHLTRKGYDHLGDLIYKAILSRL